MKNGVKEMIDKVNKTDFLRNDPAPGAHLILKRIAHVSLCLIVNEQSIHAGQYYLFFPHYLRMIFVIIFDSFISKLFARF